jgi:hypothetical protein
MSLSISEIQKAGYVILKREDLESLFINIRQKSQVDKRVKWLDKKTAIVKYKITRYWLNAAESDPFSVLEVSKGKGRNGLKKYKEQSIIDEQKRQAEQ